MATGSVLPCSLYRQECDIVEYTEDFDSVPVYFCKHHSTIHLCVNETTCMKEDWGESERCVFGGKIWPTSQVVLTEYTIEPLPKETDSLHFVHINSLQTRLAQHGCSFTSTTAKKLYSILYDLWTRDFKTMPFDEVIDMGVYLLSHKLKTVYIDKSMSVRKKKKKQKLKRQIEKRLFWEIQNGLDVTATKK